MSLQKKSRQYHKWLMLFVGVQFVIWSVSGAYMVIFDLDYIHGDHLVSENKIFLNNEQINYSIAELYTDHPNASKIELTGLLGGVVYRFRDDNNEQLLSADTGNSLLPIGENDAINIAKSHYKQLNAVVNDVTFIKDNPPVELNARHLPVWRVDFEEFTSPSFYIGVNTGELVTKRHTFWRIFDWMFSFHVMDYVEEDPSNKLLLVFTIFSVAASLFGVVLTYFRLLKPKLRKGG